MRSRASGGICGDSSAAPSAATMSSLRRRAIWVQRARSMARSSTGGRASARTTAPASPGSTSSRSQASRSRTSARWKKAAAPASRWGTARSSSATATAWPSLRTERTRMQTSSGSTSSRASSRSTSAATACACARSVAQRQNATSPAGRLRRGLERLGEALRRGLGHRPRGRQHPRAAAVAVLEADLGGVRPLAAEVGDVLGRRRAEADDRLVVVGRRGDVAVLGHQQPQEQALGEAHVLAARRPARGGSGRRAGRGRASGCAPAGRPRARGRRSRACRPRPASGRAPRRARRTRARARPGRARPRRRRAACPPTRCSRRPRPARP